MTLSRLGFYLCLEGHICGHERRAWFARSIRTGVRPQNQDFGKGPDPKALTMVGREPAGRQAAYSSLLAEFLADEGVKVGVFFDGRSRSLRRGFFLADPTSGYVHRSGLSTWSLGHAHAV